MSADQRGRLDQGRGPAPVNAAADLDQGEKSGVSSVLRRDVSFLR
jgi:hypothetical protein